ncbi:hypothetical protein LGM65_22660 [Burkholderia anthina]|uniref:helix-turn-helix transcriptional regulator n=1 Tax=Burkholderia anthina TaxID=179879 RepID=UPI001CF29B4B|nr:hypothetical protein [Burkholderia anthina]MCA8093654.1 hypothetical protein [Burkholderia anthina]
MANKAVGATTATCRHCGRLRSSCRSQPQMIHAADRGVLRGRRCHGHAGISPEMALRLEAWLGEENGGRADLWLAQQSAYDLWQARAKGVPKVARAQARV